MVFIRPKILRDGVETSFETDAKYNYMRDQQKRMNRREILPILPGTKKPMLDPAPPPPPPGTGEVDPRVQEEKLRGGAGDAGAEKGTSQQADGNAPAEPQPQGAPAPQAEPAPQQPVPRAN
jgi:hypothetical protein